MGRKEARKGKQRVELPKAFRLVAKTEIGCLSGVLRVTIEHQFNFPRFCLGVLAFSFAMLGEIERWSRKALLSRALTAFVVIAAVADLAYQMAGSEIIEFSGDGLLVRNDYFGWGRARRYPLGKCSGLSWRPDVRQKADYALECKVGWKKVRFGKYLSGEQAREVLSELQRCLPDVAQKMGLSLMSTRSRTMRMGIR